MRGIILASAGHPGGFLDLLFTRAHLSTSVTAPAPTGRHGTRMRFRVLTWRCQAVVQAQVSQGAPPYPPPEIEPPPPADPVAVAPAPVLANGRPDEHEGTRPQPKTPDLQIWFSAEGGNEAEAGRRQGVADSSGAGGLGRHLQGWLCWILSLPISARRADGVIRIPGGPQCMGPSDFRRLARPASRRESAMRAAPPCLALA